MTPMRSRLLALALILPVSGCSFAMVRPPPNRVAAADGPVECTDSSSVPVMDVGLGVGAALLVMSLVTFAALLGDGDGAFPVVSGLMAATPFVISAGLGSRAMSECRRAKARRPACDPATGVGCGPLGLPGQQPSAGRGEASPRLP